MPLFAAHFPHKTKKKNKEKGKKNERQVKYEMLSVTENLRELNKHKTTTRIRHDLDDTQNDGIATQEMGKYRNRNLIVT